MDSLLIFNDITPAHRWLTRLCLVIVELGILLLDTPDSGGCDTAAVERESHFIFSKIQEFSSPFQAGAAHDAYSAGPQLDDVNVAGEFMALTMTATIWRFLSVAGLDASASTLDLQRLRDVSSRSAEWLDARYSPIVRWARYVLGESKRGSLQV